MTTENPSRTDVRFEKWQTSMPMHVRMMPIRGQQALPLDPDANSRQQHLERWGTVHAPIGKPYEASGRMLIKVGGLAHDLADANIIYFSNGSHFDGVVGRIARVCDAVRSYTQERIVSMLTKNADDTYWDRLASSIIAGKDERPRCPRGRLSTWSTGTLDKPRERCSDVACCPTEIPF